MVSPIEATTVHLRLAASGPPLVVVVPDPTVVPALAYNISL